MLLLWLLGCMARPELHLLAVGGTHLIDGAGACQLIGAEPADAVQDLHWSNALALQAQKVGTAEVACGAEHRTLQLVAPAHLEVARTDGGGTLAVGQRISVRARLTDSQNRELEVGQYTEIAWSASATLQSANDPSAGEFGLCDTCFGQQAYLVVGEGPATVEARLGGLVGTLAVGVGVTGR